MKEIMFLFAFVSVIAATNYHPYNTKLIFDDSMRVDGTAAVFSDIIWTDKGADYALVVEARDDSAAGYSTDSASAKIELYQAFVPAIDYGASKSSKWWNTILLPSRGKGVFGDSASYILWDSLDIIQMDTTAIRVRGLTSGVANDEIGAVSTSPKGAFAYKPIDPDRVGGTVVKITGLARNAKRGVGAMWKIRVYEQASLTVNQN